RADQIFDWLHKKSVTDFTELRNIPKDLRQSLSEQYSIYPVKMQTVQISKKDGTRKYLFGLHDGNLIESVFMRYEHGNSVCVSSQVGCRMGCRFCASTTGGLLRNLTAGEILGQVYEIERDTGERVGNIVIMGTGEPLDNYDNVLAFIRLICDERGRGISERNITLSTCGLTEGIRRLSRERLAITLAISLHAPNDTVRKQLMPVANRYTIKEILSACREYYEETGRRLTFEYSLAEGINDREEDATELSSLLRGLNCHVNLIAVNPVTESGFAPPKRQTVLAFQNKLEKNHINVTIRRELGRDIDGACGQLRRRVSKGL
ncbi:MAG: 23S rRNA (adenine(2503)-C(2))-methyltransferase RlmN, partial [Lachnospiraceae bacterium]|nr:23S rRNA (adenine(2503)-C(2))-methyltransferase RlmN [Lachnospiraceae bacterium]